MLFLLMNEKDIDYLQHTGGSYGTPPGPQPNTRGSTMKGSLGGSPSVRDTREDLFSSYYYTMSQKELVLCSPFVPRSTKWIQIDESLPSSSPFYSLSAHSLPCSPRVSAALPSNGPQTDFASSMPCSPQSREAASFLLALGQDESENRPDPSVMNPHVSQKFRAHMCRSHNCFRVFPCPASLDSHEKSHFP